MLSVEASEQLFFVVFGKTGKFGAFVALKTILVQSVADFFHHCVIEIQIMKNAKTHTQHFFGF